MGGGPWERAERGSNSSIVSVNPNKRKENGDKQKPFGQMDQELMVIDLPVKRRSEWVQVLTV